MNDFWSGAMNSAGSFAVYLVVFVLCIVAQKYLAKNKKNIAVAETALNIMKMTLGKQLGPKGDLVFAALLEGFQSVKDGDLSKDDVMSQFMKFVTLSVAGKYELSEDELAIIKSVAETLYSSLEPTKQADTAVKVMMVDLRK